MIQALTARGANAPIADEQERVLLEACVRGEKRAIETLYHSYKRRIYGIVLRMVGHPDCDEVVQDVFVRLFRGLAQFRGESQFSTWVYRLTMNTTLSYLSRKKIKTEDLCEQLPAPEDMHDVVLERRLENALSSLPHGYRAILILHDIYGMEHAECAKVLGCSVGTSKSQLFKARAKMRGILGDVA